MSRDDSAMPEADPPVEGPAEHLGGRCLLYGVGAVLIGVAIMIVFWFVMARVDPAAVPRGEGPIEAAEDPLD